MAFDPTNFNALIGNPAAFSLIVLWTLFWKAFSLFISARRGHRVWFIVLLVLNTLGILDIIYIAFIGREKNQTIGAAMKTLLSRDKQKSA